jgi:hypothetical protein
VSNDFIPHHPADLSISVETKTKMAMETASRVLEEPSARAERHTTVAILVAPYIIGTCHLVEIGADVNSKLAVHPLSTLRVWSQELPEDAVEVRDIDE